MPTHYTKRTAQPRYGLSAIKFQARQATVIDAYRELSGRRDIPPKRSIVSLGGPLGRHELYPGCEINHFLEEGLISKASQYHTIDHHEEVVALNRALLAEAGIRAHCHRGDISEVLQRLIQDEGVDPAIINLDLTKSYKEGIVKLRKVMSPRNAIAGSGLIVLNVVASVGLYGRDFFKEGEELLAGDKKLKQHMALGGWYEPFKSVKYLSSGKSRSEMCTHMYWRAS